jgi:hypothetical protein
MQGGIGSEGNNGVAAVASDFSVVQSPFFSHLLVPYFYPEFARVNLNKK